MYLVEEGVLDYFRQADLVPCRLFEEQGVCLEIVDSGVRILHALHMDDTTEVEVTPAARPDATGLRFNVNVFVQRKGERVKAVVAKVVVLFKLDDSPVTHAVAPALHPDIAAYTVERISRAPSRQDMAEVKPSVGRGIVNPHDDIVRQLTPAGSNSFVWKWHIPYFYCHFTERMQHSGYLRLMEEVEDLFLADRGVSIRHMLHSKKWIPVVPSARVEMLEEAYMEEEIYTVYTVEEVYKQFTYSHRMDCYVVRGGQLIRTATGAITHGYAVINSRHDWSLVEMDAETVAVIGNACH
jgi:acyl-CoA thioesterase FadM